MSEIDALINTILRAQGRQRYLSDWDRELAEQITASAATSRTPLIIPAPLGVGELRVAIATFPAAKQRRFNYGECAKQRSDLYAKHVSVIAPDNPITLTFRAAGRGKSATWEGLRSDGWLIENGHWADERARLTDSRDIARRLVSVRSGIKLVKEIETGARAELSAIVAQDRQRVMRGDGVMAITETASRRSIDLDMAESVPDLAKFITYSPRAEYTQVRFVKVADDPEGDEQPWEGE